MPYNWKFYKVVGTSVTTISNISFDQRLKGALVQSLCRKKPEDSEQVSYIRGGTIKGKTTETFSSLIGLNVFNVLYYPYALIQLIKASIYAGLDGAPLSNKFGKIIPDTNYLRIAAKGFVQSLFIIPEFLFFSLAKIGDLVGTLLEKISALAIEKPNTNNAQTAHTSQVAPTESPRLRNPLSRLSIVTPRAARNEVDYSLAKKTNKVSQDIAIELMPTPVQIQLVAEPEDEVFKARP